MAIVVGDIAYKEDKNNIFNIYEPYLNSKYVYSNPHKHINTSNSLKLKFNRNNFVRINSC